MKSNNSHGFAQSAGPSDLNNKSNIISNSQRQKSGNMMTLSKSGVNSHLYPKNSRDLSDQEIDGIFIVNQGSLFKVTKASSQLTSAVSKIFTHDSENSLQEIGLFDVAPSLKKINIDSKIRPRQMNESISLNLSESYNYYSLPQQQSFYILEGLSNKVIEILDKFQAHLKQSYELKKKIKQLKRTVKLLKETSEISIIESNSNSSSLQNNEERIFSKEASVDENQSESSSNSSSFSFTCKWIEEIQNFLTTPEVLQLKGIQIFKQQFSQMIRQFKRNKQMVRQDNNRLLQGQISRFRKNNWENEGQIPKY